MAGTGKYCPICGREAPDLSISRFGEYFDSEEHAEEYVKEVRAARVAQAPAAPAAQTAAAPVMSAQEPAPAEQPGRRRRGGC